MAQQAQMMAPSHGDQNNHSHSPSHNNNPSMTEQEMNLRERLFPNQQIHRNDQQPGSQPSAVDPKQQQQAYHDSNLDPSIAPPEYADAQHRYHAPHEVPIAPAPESPGSAALAIADLSAAAAKGKGKSRELSQSKRAAQNRAAQRAFRQRKEVYIKRLEDQVRNSAAYPPVSAEIHRLTTDNWHLREYIALLQNTLLEKTSGYPEPQSPIQLRDPRAPPTEAYPPPPPPPVQMPTLEGDDDIGESAVNQLQAAAQAAAQEASMPYGLGQPGRDVEMGESQSDNDQQQQQVGPKPPERSSYPPQSVPTTQTPQSQGAPRAKMVSSKG